MAIASAPEEVREAARYVIPSVSDDGVAMFIEGLLSKDDDSRAPRFAFS